MNPIESRFNDGMELANRMRRGGRASYWGGYVAGLMRGFYGSEAVTNSEHQLLADASVMEDGAQGYRDGYEHVLPSRPDERPPRQTRWGHG